MTNERSRKRAPGNRKEADGFFGTLTLVLVIVAATTFPIKIFGASKKEVKEDDFFAFEKMMEPPPNLLFLSATGSGEGNSSFSIDADFHLANDYRLLLGSSSHRNRLEEESFRSGSIYLGVSSDPLDEYIMSLQIEYWGKRGEISRRGLLAGIERAGKNWNFRLGIGVRNINLSSESASSQEAEVRIISPLVELSIEYIGWTPWLVRINGEKFNYDRDMNLLSDDRVSQLFSSETMALASNFTTHGGSLELGRRFGKVYLGAEVGQNLSAVDASISKNFTLIGTYEISRKWGIQVLVGRSTFPDSVGADPARYLRVGCSYSFAENGL
jgi:hypothetical protein